MKFTDVKIDGFGVWSGLTLERLSPECTVFYGPNEAGKTTLLESIRGTLYGFTAERRLRYLPPLRGEPAGATISATTFDEGYVRIHRSTSSRESIGDLLVHSPDGTMHGESQLRRILHDVDETTYQNIFAIGLREIQELGTLTDLEAAKWLYALTVGLDRVSLCDCVTEVRESRRNLCGSEVVENVATEPSGTSLIGQLLVERDRLQADIGKLTGISRDYERLVAQRESIANDITDLEVILPKQQAEERALDAAVMVYETWHRRAALTAQIDAMAAANDWPAEAMARMERIANAARKWRRRLRQLRRQRQQSKDGIAQIQTNDALWRQTARIAAVAEHDEWILSLEQELNAADSTAKTLGVQEDSHRRKFVDLATADGASAIASAASGGSQSNFTPAWAALRGPAAAISKARHRLRAARSKSEQEQQQVKARAGELNSALPGGDKRQLTSAIDSAGQRVSQLRKRIQVDDRLAQLELTKEEFDSRIADLHERQILPPWMIISIGAIFVLGVVLILSGSLLPTSVTGSLGWPMVWLGILATGSAVAAKFTTEQSLSNQLRESQTQRQLVETQFDEAEKQRVELDRALPKTAISLPERLQSAEQELAKLEALLPLEAQRQSAEQTANQSDELHGRARRRYRKAARNWRAALAAAGMPETLSPPQARAMAESGSQLSLVQRQLADAQSDLHRRRRELAGVARQIEQIFLAAGLKPQSPKSSEQLRQLQRALEDDSAQRQRRETLGQQIKKFHGRHNLINDRLARLRRRRNRLLRECRVADPAEFHRRAAQSAQLASFITERNAASREISSILAGIASEPSTAELLAEKPFEQVELELRSAQQLAESTRREHAAKLELRGRIQEQMRTLAGDRSLAHKRFELAQVDAQLADAARRWQVLTATQQILTELKLTYERDRQPETLQEASRYLAKMTSGRYRRVWTSLDEHLLRVDDENGRALSLDVLSRGTREQLFLSLRLALVSLFARRGIKLPMILDDVLVNFDMQRAAATVEVLAEFAQQGHQLLVFTCHEHIARLFKVRDLDVRRLPDHAIGGPALPFEGEVEPVRRGQPRAPKVEAPPPPPPPEPMPDPVPVFMPPPISIIPPPAVETVVATPVGTRPKVSHVRIDQPKRVWRLSPIFRRWAAEEFSGELDDQVNPRWLLNGDAEVRIEPPAAVRKLDPEPFPLLASSGHLESITVIGPTALRIFDDEPAAVLADPLPGNEDWEL